MWILDELKKRKNDASPAMMHRDRTISWRELWDRSEAVGRWIVSSAEGDAPILIYGNKDIDILTVMIASLKTGRAYAPVDITYPVDRLLTIANATNAEVIFDFSGREISRTGTVVVAKDEIEKIAQTENNEAIPESSWVGNSDTCYILFTSGSTGEPKGVQISKANIMNFTSWFAPECELKNGSVALNQVSYSFDVSVIQLYIYLAQGVTLFNIDKKMIDDLRDLFDNLEKSDIATWVSTPAFIEICAMEDSFDDTMLPHLEKIILAGEVLTKKLVDTLHARFPKAEVINGYGPTEGTVLLSYCAVTDDMMRAEDSLPIGRVLSDAEYRIEKSDGSEAADGEKGELVVISDSISSGYYKNAAATYKVFFEAEDGRMGYHTGDIVYRRDDLIYYCRRKDFMVKLNGYRIELDDIASNLNKLDVISNSVVLPVYRDERVAYIAAFVVLEEDLGLSRAKTSIFIKNELKKLIPSYMVPRKIVTMESFPLNTNGKIDRKKITEEYL